MKQKESDFELSEDFKLLDEEVFDLGKLFYVAANSLGNIPNLYCYDDFEKRAKKLIKKIKKIKPNTEFEKLFVENAILNIENQVDYLEFFTHGKKHSVESFAKKDLGKDFFEILKSKAENFDYKQFWDYYLSYQEYLFRQIPSNEEGFRERFNQILIELKKDVLEYGKKNLGLKKDYDFDLVLGPSFKDQTSFHPTNRRMEISPYAFFVYKDGSEIKINLARVIKEIFHEIIGHGKHEANSVNMPFSMQDNSINTAIPNLHIHFEGVSQFAERESISFMEFFKEKYNLEPDYIEQIKHELKNKSASSFSNLYSYFKLKKLENDSFNPEKAFERLVKNRGLVMNQVVQDSNPFFFFRNSAYVVGLEYIENLTDELRKKLGEKKYAKNFSLIDEALSTGVFHYKVWPKFVNYFLRQNGVLD